MKIQGIDSPRVISPEKLTKLTNKELFQVHLWLHSLWKEQSQSGSPIEDVFNAHKLVLDEFDRRKLEHPHRTDGLDEVGIDKDGVVAIEEWAPVYGSGNVMGDEICLDEVLQHFKQFKIREAAVALVGGLPERGKTKGDIDILIRGDLSPEMRHIMQFRIGRMLPSELSSRVQWLGNEYDGPFTNHVPLFDLVCVKQPQFKIIEMSFEKAEDIYQDYPANGVAPKSVVQLHARGRTLHFDFRMDVGNHLVGWTLAAQKAGEVPDIEGVSQLKAIIEGYDPENGNQYLKPMVASGGGGHLYAAMKGAQPKEWLDVEGVIEPGGPGATRYEDGVFAIVDRPDVQFGYQEPQFHEYFLTGSKIGWDGRFFVRQIDRAGLKLPGEHYPSRLLWIASFAQKLLPYVLTTRAVRLGRMPPDGLSGIPKSLEIQVPPEYRYWNFKGEKAKDVRDALVKSRLFSNENVKIVDGKFRRVDVKKQYGTYTEESALPQRRQFRLFGTLYKGQQVVRTGPSNVRYDLLVQGDGDSLHLVFEGANPATVESSTAIRDSSMDVWNVREGNQEPGTLLNPTKDTTAYTSLVDDGTVEIEYGENNLTIKFNGEQLRGLYRVEEEDGGGLWVFSREDSKGAITSPSLSGGGLKNPARYPRSILDRKDKPEFVIQMFPDEVEKLCVSPEFVVVRPWKIQVVNKEVAIACGEDIVGVIELGHPFEISAHELGLLGSMHTDQVYKSTAMYAHRVICFVKYKYSIKALISGVDSKVVEIRKIEDIDTYDPSKVSDAILRDDFRIALAWFSTWKDEPGSIRFTRTQIMEVLVKIIDEMIKRGPSTVRFDPVNMTPGARAGFEAALRFGNIEVPAEMLKDITDWNTKAIDPTRNRVQLHPLATFSPMKPRKGTGEFRDIPDMLKQFATPSAMRVGIAIEPKYNGFRFVGERDANGKTLIFFEDTKVDKSYVLPGIAKSLEEFGRPLIIDGELILMNPDGSVARRAELTRFSGTSQPQDDSRAKVMVFHVLYLDDKQYTDVHYDQMREVLPAVVRKLGSHFESSPSKIVHTERDAMDAISWARKQPGSEGAMLKLALSTYSLGGETDSWVKFKAERRVVAVVLEKIKKKVPESQRTEGKTYIYRCGIPLTTEESDRWKAETEVLNGVTYADIGKTFATNLDVNIGDRLAVGVTEILIKGEPPTSIKWFTPTPEEKTTEPIDTPRTIVSIAEPQEIVKNLVSVELWKRSEERIVGAAVLIPGTADLQGDIYDGPTCRAAAYYFMENYLTDPNHGLDVMHDGKVVPNALRVLQSFVLDANTTYPVDVPASTETHLSRRRNDLTYPKDTWIMYARVLSDELWEKIKRGEFTGWSIAGFAKVREL